MAAKSEAELDSLLSTRSYLCGAVPTLTDALVAQSLGEPPPSLPHLRRWAAHLASFTDAERSAWPVGDRLSLAMPEKKPKGAKAKPAKEAPAQAAKETPAKETPPKAEAETAEDLPERLLREIDAAGESGVDSRSVAASWSVEHQRVVGALKSLEATEGLVATEQGSEKRFELSAEGKLFVAEGSHEFRLLAALPADGLPQAELMKSSPHAKIGFSKAMAAGWVAVDKGAVGGPRVLRKAPEGTVDSVADALRSLAAGTGSVPDKDLADLKKRKLLSETTTKFFTVRKGPNFTTKLEKPETDLTPEMISSGSWKDKTFKAYNFEARGAEPKGGHLHPLLKVRSEFRSIFLEMGFTEMATNNYVESSFWNFDALFQPQQHPARDAHDTFFLSRPATSTDFPRDYLERVRKVHSEGDFGSQGYGCEWSEAEAGKNLLRTHTTAVSARMLYALAQQKGGFVPTKLFSIDRVFRNETLDATHLAEFHQVEGVVAERGLSLAHLIGVLHAFFQKLGIPKLRFKPAYNPYTEPSMEIFSYHEGLKKWVEIGNSGIFRPEMLLPMGLPEDVSVIAWGLSLERPTMIRYGYDNIRDLFGPKVNLKMVQDNPLCRLDK